MIKEKHKNFFTSIVVFSVSLVTVIILTNVFQAFASEMQIKSLLEINEKNNIEEFSYEVTTDNHAVDSIELLNMVTVTDLQANSNNDMPATLLEFVDEEKQYSVYFNTLNQSANKNDSVDKNKEKAYILDNLGETANFKGTRSWVISNQSGTDKILDIALENVINLENGCNDQEKAVQPDCDQVGKVGDFGKIINLKVALDGIDRVESTLANDQQDKIANDWANLPAVVLKPKEKRIITIHWFVNENFYKNEIQSDSVSFEVVFNLSKDAKTKQANKKQVAFDVVNKDTDYFVDTDKDGLSDYEEINVYQTNPLSADTDGDGYLDKIEIMNGYNPLEAAKK